MINIADYKGFYLQKGTDTVKESNAEWNILVQKFDWGMLMLKPKAYAETDNKDQHGKYVFVPNQLKFESNKIKLTFLYMGEFMTFYNKLTEFLTYLSTGGYLKIQDKFSGVGRQKVRWTDSEAPNMITQSALEGDKFTFALTFEIDDPVTNINIAPLKNNPISIFFEEATYQYVPAILTATHPVASDLSINMTGSTTEQIIIHKGSMLGKANISMGGESVAVSINPKADNTYNYTIPGIVSIPPLTTKRINNITVKSLFFESSPAIDLKPTYIPNSNIIGFIKIEEKTYEWTILKSTTNTLIKISSDSIGQTGILKFGTTSDQHDAYEDAYYKYAIPNNVYIRAQNFITATSERLSAEKIKITFKAESPVHSPIQYQLKIIDGYTYMSEIRTGDTFSYLEIDYNKISGKQCDINILSVNNVLNETSDDMYIYDITPRIYVDKSLLNMNISVTVGSATKTYVPIQFSSDDSVYSDIQISLNNVETAILKKGLSSVVLNSNLSNQDVALSIIPSSDSMYNYFISNTIHLPALLPKTDNHITFYFGKITETVIPVIFTSEYPVYENIEIKINESDSLKTNLIAQSSTATILNTSIQNKTVPLSIFPETDNEYNYIISKNIVIPAFLLPNEISVLSGINTENEVVITYMAENPVDSDVKIRMAIEDYVVPQTINKGFQKQEFIVSNELTGKNAKLTISAVNGNADSDSDSVYLYRVIPNIYIRSLNSINVSFEKTDQGKIKIMFTADFPVQSEITIKVQTQVRVYLDKIWENDTSVYILLSDADMSTSASISTIINGEQSKEDAVYFYKIPESILIER